MVCCKKIPTSGVTFHASLTGERARPDAARAPRVRACVGLGSEGGCGDACGDVNQKNDDDGRGEIKEEKYYVGVFFSAT